MISATSRKERFGLSTPNENYVCPQCGPDSNGGEIHSLMYHAFPAMSLEEAEQYLKFESRPTDAIAEFLHEVKIVLQKVLPDWHEEADDMSFHSGNVMCEMTYGDVREIKRILKMLDDLKNL